MVADAVVRVAVDVARMRLVKAFEVGVELRFLCQLDHACTLSMRSHARGLPRGRDDLALGHRPPSQSHCSVTRDQIRSVTAAASAGVGSDRPGSAAARRSESARGAADPPAAAHSLRPITATGTTGAPVCSASRQHPVGRSERPGRVRVPSGNMQTQSPRSRIARAVSIARVSPHRDRPGRRRACSSPAAHRVQKCSFFAT